MLKANLVLQPIFNLLFLLIIKLKLDSASQNPVTKEGFNLPEVVEYFVYNL